MEGIDVGLPSWASLLTTDREGTEKQKQILRSAYPNVVGAPSCSAQDDTSCGWELKV